MNIPLIYKRAKLSDFGEEVKQRVRLAESCGDLITVIGPNGSGKTHLAMAVARQVPGAIVYHAAEFALEAQAIVADWGMRALNTWVRDIYEHEKIVIFDDLGAEKMTEFIHQAYVLIVSHREAERFPTMFTTNFTIEEIAENIDKRIASQMAGGEAVNIARQIP